MAATRPNIVCLLTDQWRASATGYAGDSDEKRFWDGYDAFAQTKDAQAYLHARRGTGKPFVMLVSHGGPRTYR